MDNKILKDIRTFNRFFAVELNIFNRNALGTRYSLIEGRIIGEIGRNPGCSAASIASLLHMDKSFLSRILNKLEEYALIERITSEADSRKKQLYLTAKGTKAYEELEALSDKQAADMLSGLNQQEIAKVLDCMKYLQEVLK